MSVIEGGNHFSHWSGLYDILRWSGSAGAPQRLPPGDGGVCVCKGSLISLLLAQSPGLTALLPLGLKLNMHLCVLEVDVDGSSSVGRLIAAGIGTLISSRSLG